MKRIERNDRGPSPPPGRRAEASAEALPGRAAAPETLALPQRRQGGALAKSGAAPGRLQNPGGRRLRSPPEPRIDLDELWAPARPGRIETDRDFLPGALAVLDVPASPLRRVMGLALGALLASVLAWSWFGHIDVYAQATGKIQASGRTKVVQPQETGTVIAIKVHNGDSVKENDVLVALDPTTALADQTVVKDSLNNERAEIARRRAEIAAAAAHPVAINVSVAWPDDLPAAVRQREDQALRSDLATLAATLANLDAQKAEKITERDKYATSIVPERAVIDLVTEHVAMGNELFKGGWDSRATLIALLEQLQSATLQLKSLEGSLEQAKAAIPVIESQIAETLQAFVTTNTAALVLAQQKQDELVQSLAKATAKLNNMTLRASTSGVIEASAITTLGQVVSSGQQVMQIVPETSPIEIECYVLNTDAGFIKVGQTATIKVDTFPYTRYGTIEGRVTKVATDALPGKQAPQQGASATANLDGAMSVSSAAQQTSDLVFPVTVVPLQTSIMVGGRPMPLTSGMTTSIEIKTESRRAIDYILSPIKAVLATAAQER